MHTAIVYGSVREARAGVRVVRYLTAPLHRRGHMTAVIDAVEQRLPLLDRMYKEYECGSAPIVLEGIVRLTSVEREAPSGIRDHAAATAFLHRFAASARKIRSVERETRWR